MYIDKTILNVLISITQLVQKSRRAKMIVNIGRQRISISFVDMVLSFDNNFRKCLKISNLIRHKEQLNALRRIRLTKANKIRWSFPIVIRNHPFVTMDN